ncbi:MAG TPA: preprotein translocase subunit SecG [Steroidobacteraceae bacterium]|nr:preprotein translocase subunit SecG [Steroidobacteraceae bacterium]
MNWLNTLTMIVHLFLAVGIIGLVLIQRGKGADAGAGFGSGASGTVFGARGSASFLSRTTAIFAGLFFITSLTLAYFSNHGSHTADVSVTDREAAASVSSSAPAVVQQAASSAASVVVPATGVQTQQSAASSSAAATK